MNKRSAVIMALGLTAALVAGGVAFAAGIGPTAGEASTAVAPAVVKQDPLVRTRTRTVTIHRQGDASGAGVTVLGGSGTSGARKYSSSLLPTRATPMGG